MIIFWRMILAHFVADFTLQTNFIADWKRTSRWGLAVHVLTHPLTYAIIVWPYLTQVWIQTPWIRLQGWACILILTFFHWLEDEWRIHSIRATRSPDSTGYFLWDQVVHLTLILALSPTFTGAPAEKKVLLLLCAVLLAHFTSVLIFFLETDLWGTSSVLETKKYQYMGNAFWGPPFSCCRGRGSFWWWAGWGG